MELKALFLLLIGHWVFDFILQTDKQAKGKSKNWGDLLSHTSIYSLCFILLVMWLTPVSYIGCLLFGVVTFIAHTITDYFTSRLNSYLWNKGEVHYFFVSVGFDQLLHYTQLIFTYIIVLLYF